MLHHLRGRMQVVESDDRDVLAVAAIDGLDPTDGQAPPHPVQAVVVFNDHREPRRISVDLLPPPGFAADGPIVILKLDDLLIVPKKKIQRGCLGVWYST